MTEVSSHALAVGSMLNHYRIDRVLGQGGFGLIYRATDTILSIDVAIKEFFPEFLQCVRGPGGTIELKSPEKKGLFDKCRNMFVDEARTLAQLRHENIVRILSFFEVNNSAYMVMEFVAGESLEEKFRRERCRQEADLLAVLMPLLSALKTMHDRGIVHRDIKPGNIHIRPDGAPMLLDFGSSRRFVLEQTRDLTTLVTPGYAPIEQYAGKSSEHGPWTDIYSLGAMLYRAVSGQAPMAAVTRSKGLLDGTGDPMPPASEVGRDRYSRFFLAAVDAALRVLREERPQDADVWAAMFSADATARLIRTVADTRKDRELILKTIEEIPFFRGFSPYEKKRIVANHTRILQCDNGAYIVREGSRDDSFYILLSGSVSVIKDGNPTPISELEPGAIFGEISFLARFKRTANVVANQPCLVIELNKELMETLGADIREKIKDQIIKQLLHRMNRMNQIMHSVARSSNDIIGMHVDMRDQQMDITVMESASIPSV